MIRTQSRTAAFSLLEILVVLGIAAVIASLALGGFSSYQGSQRRSTCQGNLVQIYRACRLYSNDNDSFPLYTRPVNGGSTDSHVGGLSMLWGRFDDSVSPAVVRPPSDGVLSYLKSSAPLHCPADVALNNGTVPGPTKDDGNGGRIVDPAYLSYQKPDTLDNTQLTYDDVRTKSTGDVDFARQLQHRTTSAIINIPTPSNTVVTWCPYHRGLSGKPDDVLFYDGSVRRMEVAQAANCLPGRPVATGWRRLSECSTSTAASNEGAALAQP